MSSPFSACGRMFFAVSGLMKLFRFLHTGLAVILILMGLKMIAADYYKVPTLAMLGVVAGVLMISMVASLLFPGQNQQNKNARSDVEFHLKILTDATP